MAATGIAPRSPRHRLELWQRARAGRRRTGRHRSGHPRAGYPHAGHHRATRCRRPTATDRAYLDRHAALRPAAALRLQRPAHRRLRSGRSQPMGGRCRERSGRFSANGGTVQREKRPLLSQWWDGAEQRPLRPCGRGLSSQLTCYVPGFRSRFIGARSHSLSRHGN